MYHGTIMTNAETGRSATDCNTVKRCGTAEARHVSASDIKKAADVLESGGVVAFPTETSYGLGAVADNEAALKRIYEIKKRPADKPLLVIVDTTDRITELAEEIPREAEILMQRFWPGPLTILFPARKGLAWPLHCGTGRIGIRISDNPYAGALCSMLGRPVTATSANLSGMPPAASAAEVRNQLHDPAPDFILDGGELQNGACSTIIAVVPPEKGHNRADAGRVRIVREGVIPSEEIFSTL